MASRYPDNACALLALPPGAVKEFGGRDALLRVHTQTQAGRGDLVPTRSASSVKQKYLQLTFSNEKSTDTLPSPQPQSVPLMARRSFPSLEQMAPVYRAP